MLDDFFQSLFLCALLLFWLCVYHGIRVQVSRQTGCLHPMLVILQDEWYRETLPCLCCYVHVFGVYCALLGASHCLLYYFFLPFFSSGKMLNLLFA